MSKAASLLILANLLVVNTVSHISTHRGSIEAQFHVAVGGQVVLPCRTALSTSVDWRYHWSPFESPSIVFSNNSISDNIPSRSRITVAHTGGDYSLTINGALADDTGLYTCIEDGGFGYKHIFSVLVDEAHRGSIEAQFHVAVGGRVDLPCRTTLQSSVDWRYHWSPFESWSFVYSNYKMYENIPSRITVVHNTTGDYNLTISGAVANDTGLYTCIEDGGFGSKHIFSVLVAEVLLTAAGPSEFGSTTPLTGASPNGAVATSPVIIVVVVVVVIVSVVVIVVMIVCVRRRTRDEERVSNRTLMSSDGSAQSEFRTLAQLRV